MAIPQKINITSNTDFEAARYLHSLRPYRSTIRPKGQKKSRLEIRQQIRMRAPKSVTLPSGQKVDVGGGGAGFYYPGLKSSNAKVRANAVAKSQAAFLGSVMPAVAKFGEQQERIKIQSIPGYAENYKKKIRDFLSQQQALENMKQETIPGYGKLVQESKGLGTGGTKTFIDPNKVRSQVNRPGLGGSLAIQKLSKEDPNRARKILGLKPNEALPTIGLVAKNDITDPYYTARSVAQIQGSKISDAEVNALPPQAAQYVAAEQDQKGSGKDIIKQYGGNVLGPYGDLTRKRLIKQAERNGWKNQEWNTLTDERVLELALSSPAGTVEQELRDWAKGVGNEARAYATLPVAATVIAGEAARGNFDPIKEMAVQSGKDYLNLWKAGATGDFGYLYNYAKKNPISTSLSVVEGLGVAGKVASFAGKTKIGQGALKRLPKGEALAAIPLQRMFTYTPPGLNEPLTVGPVRQNIFNQFLAPARRAILQYDPQGNPGRVRSALARAARSYRQGKYGVQARAASSGTGLALHNGQVAARKVTAGLERSLLGISEKMRKRIAFELAVAPRVIIDGRAIETSPGKFADELQKKLDEGKFMQLDGSVTDITSDASRRELQAAIREYRSLDEISRDDVLKVLEKPRGILVRLLEDTPIIEQAAAVEMTNQRILLAMGVDQDALTSRLYDLTRWVVESDLKNAKIVGKTNASLDERLAIIAKEMEYLRSIEGPQSDVPKVPYGRQRSGLREGEVAGETPAGPELAPGVSEALVAKSPEPGKVFGPEISPRVKVLAKPSVDSYPRLRGKPIKSDLDYGPTPTIRSLVAKGRKWVSYKGSEYDRQRAYNALSHIYLYNLVIPGFEDSPIPFAAIPVVRNDTINAILDGIDLETTLTKAEYDQAVARAIEISTPIDPALSKVSRQDIQAYIEAIDAYSPEDLILDGSPNTKLLADRFAPFLDATFGKQEKPVPAAKKQPQAPVPTPTQAGEIPPVGIAANRGTAIEVTPEVQLASDKYFEEQMRNTKRVPRDIANEDQPAIRDLDMNEVHIASIASWLSQLAPYASSKEMRDLIAQTQAKIKRLLVSPQRTRIMGDAPIREIGRYGTIRFRFEVYVDRFESGKKGILEPRVWVTALFDSFDGRYPQTNFAVSTLDAKLLHDALTGDAYSAAQQLNDLVPTLSGMIDTLENNIHTGSVARGIANDPKRIGPLRDLPRYIADHNGNVTASGLEAPGTVHPLMPHLKLVLDDGFKQLETLDRTTYKLSEEPPIRPGTVPFTQTNRVTLDGSTAASEVGPKPEPAAVPERSPQPQPEPVPPTTAAQEETLPPTPAAPEPAVQPQPPVTPPVAEPAPTPSPVYQGVYHGPAPEPQTPPPPFLPITDARRLLMPMGSYIPRIPPPEEIDRVIRESLQLAPNGAKLVPPTRLEPDGVTRGITYWRYAFGDNGRLIALVKHGGDSWGAAETLLHEIIHGIPRELKVTNRADLRVIEQWIGRPLDKWRADDHERFVDSLIKYLSTGDAPNKKLQKLYDALRTYLLNAVSQITRIRRGYQDTNIPDDLKDVFRRYFGYNGKSFANGLPKPTSSPIRTALREAAIKSGVLPDEADTILSLMDARARMWSTLTKRSPNLWWEAANGAGIRGAIAVKYDAQLSVSGIGAWIKWLNNEIRLLNAQRQGAVPLAAEMMIQNTERAVKSGGARGPQLFLSTARRGGGVSTREQARLAAGTPESLGTAILGPRGVRRTGKSGALGQIDLNMATVIRNAQVPSRMAAIYEGLSKFLRENSEPLTIDSIEKLDELRARKLDAREFVAIDTNKAFKINDPREADAIMRHLNNAVDDPEADTLEIMRVSVSELGSGQYDAWAKKIENGGEVNILIIPTRTWAQMRKVLDESIKAQDPSWFTKASQAWQKANLTILPRTPAANISGNAILAIYKGFRPQAFVRAWRMMRDGTLPSEVQSRGIYGLLTESTAENLRFRKLLKPIRFWMSGMQRLNILSEDLARATLYIDEVMTQVNKETKRGALSRIVGMNEDAKKLFDAVMRGEVDTPETQRIQLESLQKAEDWLGGYRRGGTAERALAVAVPFNQWYRHILRLTFLTMPYEYPGRSAMLQALAQMGEEYQRENGVWPEWAQDILPLWEDERRTRFGKGRVIGGIRTSSLNPFSTATEVANFVENPAQTLINLGSPLAQAIIQSALVIDMKDTGGVAVYDPATGQRIERGLNPEYANFVARQVESLLPIAFLRDPSQSTTSSFFAPGERKYKRPRGLEPTRIPNTIWIKLLKAIGISPTVIDAQGPIERARLDSYAANLRKRQYTGNR